MTLLLGIAIVWGATAAIGLPLCWYALTRPLTAVDEECSRLDRRLVMQERAKQQRRVVDRSRKARRGSDDFVGLHSV